MNLARTNLVLLILLFVALTTAWAMHIDSEQPNVQIFPDMQYSPAFDAYSANPHFANGQTLQPPPLGVIARGETVLHFAPTLADAIRAGEELTSPIAAGDSRAIERGAQIYRVCCTVCHGPQGLGDGLVTKRGFPPPPSLLTGKSVQMKDGQLFHILTYGQGGMASYASQISPDDRWKAIVYVRNLQAKAQRPVEAARPTERQPAAPPPAKIPDGGRTNP